MCIAALCLAWPASFVLAQGPSVTAVLENSETAVGQSVQLQIKVAGSAGSTPPSDIVVDGLEIRYAGQSQLLEGRNFQFSYSFTYNYTVVPMKEGTFKIPPQTIRVGSSSLRTPELTLNVAASPSRSTRSNRGADRVDPNKVGFVELILPKSDAYVGEMIPVQIRLGFNVRVPIQSLGSGMQIAGQGFTTQKMPEPRQTIETINGTSYQVFIFKTAISPARTGKLEIGPAEVNPVVRVARTQPRNPGLPRDLFDMNDPFFNSFFNDPTFAPSVPKEIKLKSEPATIEVKPLPPKAPPGFSGAVGNFAMKAEANPKSVKAGDPITVTAALSGRGNFDRVAAPVLEDESGWHTYPPSAKFTQDDDVGISGTKTFETVLSANERKEHLPPLVFSFFDPARGEYVTLRSEAIPVRAEGAAPAPVAAATAPINPQIPAATPAPKQQDILSQLTDQPTAARSFEPLYLRPYFWAAQLIPLFALLGFIAWKMREARLADRERQRIAALEREASEVQRRLRRESATPQQYFFDAARAVQLKTALAKKVDPSVVDADLALSVFELDQPMRERMRALFARRDEMRYSGGDNGLGASPPQNQRELLDLIENLRA